jgi:hypothetical protein
LKAIQSSVPKTGALSESDWRGFFHAVAGVRKTTISTQARARVGITLLLLSVLKT